MNFLNSILQQIFGISKSREKFLLILFKTIMAIPSKINFRNLSRFCNLSEKTISRNFRRAFDFIKFNLLLLQDVLNMSKEHLLAVDCSFITKSGTRTYGLGKFFNGLSQRPEKGLEICLVSLIDPVLNTAFSLSATQTPTFEEINTSRNIGKDESRIDFYLDCLANVYKNIINKVRYCVADGYFTKVKFINGILNLSLNFIGKLRSDANLKFLYSGIPNKRGRPKQFDGKVKFAELKRFQYVKEIDGDISLYTAVVYSVNLKRKIRIALLVNHRNKNKVGYAVLFSTDIELSAEEIYKYYKSRFQIEFLFRDSKQYTGLCDCQSTKKEALDFHFNASLTTLNIAKIEALKQHNFNEPFVFSMASIKRIAFNELLIENIFSKLGFDLSFIKINPIYNELRNYGVIAA